MTDATGGPTGRDPALRTPEPRQPRVADVRAAAERTLAGSASRTARVPPPRADDDSLLAAGIDTLQAKTRELQAWSARQTAVSRDTVKLHPFTSCAATFGAGVLFGILLMRR